ncbi:hypothetical protein [Nocardioides marmoribigeumensis]|uniref:DUF2269 family protein n=1 Tax=Nocardioides marmoribigeumensis TaxID=433649 RepID=A0ABU2BXF2_9ACTN|nr:hypothetical protein [Nocardioides marmoribigeumensis]MDR7363080.1 hypothetical protein [Nocardioides marmoribigeumensis]
MSPSLITLLLTGLASLVVVLTRMRMVKEGRAAGRAAVSRWLVDVHTVGGVLAVVLWVAMFVVGDRRLGAAALPLWWATVVAGLLILVRWLPARGRHSSGPVADAWGDGPGLSILAHVGLLVGVLVFSVYLLLDQIP